MGRGIGINIRRQWLPILPACGPFMPNFYIGKWLGDRCSDFRRGHSHPHTFVAGKHSLVSPMGLLDMHEDQPASDNRQAPSQHQPAAAWQLELHGLSLAQAKQSRAATDMV